jgi:hypothetical protein
MSRKRHKSREESKTGKQRQSFQAGDNCQMMNAYYCYGKRSSYERDILSKENNYAISRKGTALEGEWFVLASCVKDKLLQRTTQKNILNLSDIWRSQMPECILYTLQDAQHCFKNIQSGKIFHLPYESQTESVP